MWQGDSAWSRAGMLLFFLLVLSTSPFAYGQPTQAENEVSNASASNGIPSPVLIELFTSEGCSSCPPVDVLLKKLDAAQPIPGAQLIVLSEHVTYWDHDGWKDPNSSPALTERQNSYESALGEKTLYTPQLIVDGTYQVHAGDPKQLEQTLQKAAATPKVPVHIGDVTVDEGNPTLLRTRVETGPNSEKHNADVYVAVALDHVESQVLRGENGGRHLVHVAVVQEFTRVGRVSQGKSFAQDVQLKLRSGTDPKNVRLVIFVQESGPAKILGAALRKPTI